MVFPDRIHKMNGIMISKIGLRIKATARLEAGRCAEEVGIAVVATPLEWRSTRDRLKPGLHT
jgi:hypothetical protein